MARAAIFLGFVRDLRNGVSDANSKHGMALSDAAMRHMDNQSQPAEIPERTLTKQICERRASSHARKKNTPLANGQISVCHLSLLQARPHNPAALHLSTLVNQPSPRTGIPALHQHGRSDPPAQNQSPLHRAKPGARSSLPHAATLVVLQARP